MTFRILIIAVIVGSAASVRADTERSFWVHASLGLITQRGYFGPDYPATPMPAQEQVRNAARLLTTHYAANRLYLVYHRELPPEDARRLFLWWRESCSKEVELVPALVTRMYDRAQTPVFNAEELDALAQFFRERINPTRCAVFDIAEKRDLHESVAVLVREFPRGLIRLGIQPGEPLDAPFTAAVADTWSALCHGTRNVEDWQQPGFGAETLKKWVLARNGGTRPVTWDLVAVAWDYRVTARGGFPGYDDAEKNMPLPAGRNRAAWQLIRDTATPALLGGFSSDLCILQENSRSKQHDGRDGSFYECLKRGEVYRGYYAEPLEEIAAVFREKTQ